MISSRFRLTVAAVAVALASCALEAGSAEFAGATDRVFELIDAADYDGLYREASETFRAPPEDPDSFRRYMAANAEKLGRCQTPRPRKPPTTILTPNGLVTYQDFIRACASGVVDIQVSTIQRQGRPRLIGLHYYGDALAESDPLASRPEWITQADLDLLEKLGLDPRADLEARANYHWRWRARTAFTAGDYRCPGGSTIDISRTIKVVIAPPASACEKASQARTEMLKLASDGTTKPLGD